MTDTIIAVYGSPTKASRAVRDLRLAGIPADAVRQRDSAGRSDGMTEASGKPGFWANLLGVEEPAGDDAAPLPCAFVIVDTTRSQLAKVIQVLELHQPLDMDEWGEECRVLDGADIDPADESDVHAASGSEAVIVSDTIAGGDTSSVAANDTSVHRVLVEMPVGATVTLRSKPAAGGADEGAMGVAADAAHRAG